MFFFFFDELYHIPEIEQAFRTICLNKLLYDGYFDMSKYIFARVKKDEMLSKLLKENSKFSVLYKKSYPSKEMAQEFWFQNFSINYSNNESGQILYIEAEAIVNWVYRICKNSGERVEFTMQLFAREKSLHHIKNNIKYSGGVFYNSSKVEVHFIKNVSGLNYFLSGYKDKNAALFFRGHSNSNYTLLPSIMRNKKLKENEVNLYNELIIECPEYFGNCHTHLEKLVTMQHYGLPTRLLDITRNPLVALFLPVKATLRILGKSFLSQRIKAVSNFLKAIRYQYYLAYRCFHTIIKRVFAN